MNQKIPLLEPRGSGASASDTPGAKPRTRLMPTATGTRDAAIARAIEICNAEADAFAELAADMPWIRGRRAPRCTQRMHASLPRICRPSAHPDHQRSGRRAHAGRARFAGKSGPARPTSRLWGDGRGAILIANDPALERRVGLDPAREWHGHHRTDLGMPDRRGRRRGRHGGHRLRGLELVHARRGEWLRQQLGW